MVVAMKSPQEMAVAYSFERAHRWVFSVVPFVLSRSPSSGPMSLSRRWEHYRCRLSHHSDSAWGRQGPVVAHLMRTPWVYFEHRPLRCLGTKMSRWLRHVSPGYIHQWKEQAARISSPAGWRRLNSGSCCQC